jgi:hypothetical protein
LPGSADITRSVKRRSFASEGVTRHHGHCTSKRSRLMRRRRYEVQAGICTRAFPAHPCRSC